MEFDDIRQPDLFQKQESSRSMARSNPLAHHLAWLVPMAIRESISQARCRTPKPSKTSPSLSRYDEKIIKHLEKHGSWNQMAKDSWQSMGFNLQSAQKRTNHLKKLGLIDRHHRPTKLCLERLKEKEKKQNLRSLKRAALVKNLREKTASQAFHSLSLPQRKRRTQLG